jgi:hypothetical protein
MTTEVQAPDLTDELPPTARRKKGRARKIILGVVLLIVAAIAAAGVTVGVTYANGGTQALMSVAAGLPIPDAAREPAFTQAVKAGGGQYAAGKSESDVVAEARALCKRLDSGESIKDVAVSASTGVTDLQGFGTVMGTGIVMFCPSHTAEMNQYLAAIGQGNKAP